MKVENIILALSAVGIGIYIATQLSQESAAVTDTGSVPPYDPYSTNDPSTAYAGTIEPMAKERFSPRTLKTSPQELAKIVSFEGQRTTAYSDGAGNLTIGIGHMIRPGDGLTAQSVLTADQMNSIFMDDIADAENSIYSRVTAPLSQGEFDALVDFIFQFGDSKFGSSSLLRLLNLRNYDSIPAEFGKWINVAGKPSAQVTARRADDSATFLT